MKIILLIVVTSVVGLSVVFGGFYYRYVTNTDTPYDEIGITLNGWMPGPIKTWGCGKLQETFAEKMPPYGCEADGDSTAWRS